MPAEAPPRMRLYDSAQLDAVLDTMARKASVLLAGRPAVTLVGILRRGAPLSEMLRERLLRASRMPPMPLLQLRIQRYADDLTLVHPETRLTEDPAHAALDLGGQTVLLVDDVLYHGNSLLRAIGYLERKGAAEIRTAMLVDRDVSVLPLRADVVGLRLNVAPGDVVECRVPPYEPEFAIDIVRPRAR